MSYGATPSLSESLFTYERRPHAVSTVEYGMASSNPMIPDTPGTLSVPTDGMKFRSRFPMYLKKRDDDDDAIHSKFDPAGLQPPDFGSSFYSI